MDFGRAIRTCRAIRGWQQEDVAKRAGLSAAYVSLIEAGRRTPSSAALRKLAKALLVPESLVVLLASDLSALPISEGKTYDRLARSLLQLLSEATRDKISDVAR